MHLINGLYDCHRNRVPVLAIAAHIPSSEIGSTISKKPIQLNYSASAAICEMVSNPEQIPQVLGIAMRKAILE